MAGTSIDPAALLHDLLRTPFDPHLRVALFYLATTVIIAFLIWVLRGKPAPFLTWLLPRSVYRHPSNWVDVKIFIALRLMGALGLLGAAVLTPTVAYYMLVSLSQIAGGVYDPPPITPARAVLATVLIVIAYDFCVYWVHRLHHEAPVLWPFHSVHHSAEVLTPLTTTRQHPLYTVFSLLFKSLVVGSVQALILFALIGKLSLLTIGGANALYVAFYTLGANFRHSHIWISYGRALEHILISPAQHQIHHSVELRHHNKNYGEVLAIWDWMFGTLYIPDRPEVLTFGIADAQGNRIEQPHTGLVSAMLGPFRDSYRVLRRRPPPSETETRPQ